jgi:hypothetical protein
MSCTYGCSNVHPVQTAGSSLLRIYVISVIRLHRSLTYMPCTGRVLRKGNQRGNDDESTALAVLAFANHFPVLNRKAQRSDIQIHLPEESPPTPARRRIPAHRDSQASSIPSFRSPGESRFGRRGRGSGAGEWGRRRRAP